MSSIIVIFDDVSKRFIKLDRSILNAKSVTICNSINELPRLEDTQDEIIVVMFEYLVRTPEYSLFMPLFKEFTNLRFICMCNSEEVCLTASQYGEVFRCDVSTVDYELVQAAIYKDTSFNSDSYDSYKDSLETAKKLLDDKISTEVETVARDFIACDKRKNELLSEVTLLKNELVKVTQQKDILQKENEKWSEGCKRLVNRAEKQTQILKQFETVLSRDIYTKLNINDYHKRPEIIYLKVFKDFEGLELLLETLIDTFRIQKQKSVKVVRLYDSTGCRSMKLVPSYYTQLRNHYSADQITTNDFLVKSGDYFNLMDRLLSNKYNLDLLIILDFKDFDDVILRGNYASFSLCDTVKHARLFGLNQNFTIVGEKSEEWHGWSDINVEGLSKEDAFIKLSSMPSIKLIIEMSEKIRTSF